MKKPKDTARLDWMLWIRKQTDMKFRAWRRAGKGERMNVLG